MEEVFRGPEWSRTQVPKVSETDTRRRRLLTGLNTALDQPWTLTLVSAPAGSGKTRLLAQWARDLIEQGISVAWMTLDPADDDLAILRSALARIDDPRVRAELSTVPNTPSRATARMLARSVSSAAAPVVVIIDDVHWVQDEVLAECIATFARSVSGSAHVVLSGRGMGRLPLAKTRISGVALELTGSELAFTGDEIHAYFADRGARVSQGEVAAILTRTEGWVTGLRLMELSSGGVNAAVVTAGSVHGGSSAVAEYFLEEMVGTLGADVRDFLVRTAVPEAFTIDLARVLTGRSDVHEMIDRLSRHGVLFDQRGQDPVWYHYHPLLREFICARLAPTLDVSATDMDRVTAEWFAAHREYLPALNHAVRAEDPVGLAMVLTRCGLQLVLTGHADAVSAALEKVPEPFRMDPGVQKLIAAAELALGDASPAAAVLASTSSESAGSDSDQVWRAALDLHTAVRTGGIEEALERLEGMGPVMSGEPQVDAYVHLQACMGELYVGRMDAADRWGRSAVDLARSAGLVAAELQAFTVLDTIALYRDRLSDVMHYGTQADQRWAELGEPEDLFYQGTRIWRAWAMRERGDVRGGHQLLLDAAPVVLAGNEKAIAGGVRGMIALFEAVGATDTREAAVALTEDLAPRVDQPLPPNWFAIAGVPAVHALNRLGHLELRDRFIAAVGRRLDRSGDHAVMEAIAALHDGDLAGAREHVRRVVNGDAVCIADSSMIDAWLVEAKLDVQHGHPEQAQAALSTALQLGSPEGHVQRFLEAGPVIRQLLAARATAASRGPFAQSVRDAFAAAVVPTGEDLTARELVVAEGLLRGDTLRMIAEREYVTLNTMKTHVRNIYRKLGVSDRAGLAAAVRALEINVIDEGVSLRTDR